MELNFLKEKIKLITNNYKETTSSIDFWDEQQKYFTRITEEDNKIIITEAAKTATFVNIYNKNDYLNINNHLNNCFNFINLLKNK